MGREKGGARDGRMRGMLSRKGKAGDGDSTAILCFIMDQRIKRIKQGADLGRHRFDDAGDQRCQASKTRPKTAREGMNEEILIITRDVGIYVQLLYGSSKHR